MLMSAELMSTELPLYSVSTLSNMTKALAVERLHADGTLYSHVSLSKAFTSTSCGIGVSGSGKKMSAAIRPSVICAPICWSPPRGPLATLSTTRLGQRAIICVPVVPVATSEQRSNTLRCCATKSHSSAFLESCAIKAIRFFSLIKVIAMKVSNKLASLFAVGLLSSALGAQANTAQCSAAMSFEFRTLDKGAKANICQAGTKAVMVVNTASECGFTPQYEGLEALHKKYAKQGLTIVGFPANDFGAQERGSNDKIADFCKKNYGVSFLMSQKLEAPIKDHPLYARLIASSAQAPKWNFHKYLITKDGKVQSFGSKVEPQGTEVLAAGEAALK
jgi:glutathione peroxidase